MESGLTRNQIITELTKSPHGNLPAYVPIVSRATKDEAEFTAHLIAWNKEHGQVRDSHVALPVITLAARGFPEDFVENSFAHIATLDPRNLVRALNFARGRYHCDHRPSSHDENGNCRVMKHDQATKQKVACPCVGIKVGRGVDLPAKRDKRLRGVVERYLRVREAAPKWWDATAVQHRESLKTLYAMLGIEAGARAHDILFNRKYPGGSIFEAIAQLKNMTAQEAAGTIMNRKIPFLVAHGALGARLKEKDVILALLGAMSPSEVVTNAKLFEKLGVASDPVLKAAFEEALGRTAKNTKKGLLKTSKAATAIKDERLKAKVQEVQERQIAASKGIDGNWLVLADKSGSMQRAIESARHVAATLAKLVRGQVALVFFNTAPQFFDVTGKTYDEIATATKNVIANGGTSIGCGLLYAIERKLEIDGIAIVSDGGDNTAPSFHDVYGPFVQATGKQVPVYLYHLTGEADVLSRNMSARGYDLQRFEVDAVDYYSIPNLAATMRANRYSLADEIMETPLLTLEEVFSGNINA